MNEIISIIIIIAIVITVYAANELLKKDKYSKTPFETKNEDMLSYNELTTEEEIVMLLKNIAKNQKTIKTNTTIIAIILLIPIVISIFLWATGISIASLLFNHSF